MKDLLASPEGIEQGKSHTVGTKGVRALLPIFAKIKTGYRGRRRASLASARALGAALLMLALAAGLRADLAVPDLSGKWRQFITADGDDIPSSKGAILELTKKGDGYQAGATVAKWRGDYTVGESGLLYKPNGSLFLKGIGGFKRLSEDEIKSIQIEAKKREAKRRNDEALRAEQLKADKARSVVMASYSTPVNGPLDGFWRGNGGVHWHQFKFKVTNGVSALALKDILVKQASGDKVEFKEKKGIVELKFTATQDAGDARRHLKYQVLLEPDKDLDVCAAVACTDQESYQETVTHEAQQQQSTTYTFGANGGASTQTYLVPAWTEVVTQYRYIDLTNDDAIALLGNLILKMILKHDGKGEQEDQQKGQGKAQKDQAEVPAAVKGVVAKVYLKDGREFDGTVTEAGKKSLVIVGNDGNSQEIEFKMIKKVLDADGDFISLKKNKKGCVKSLQKWLFSQSSG